MRLVRYRARGGPAWGIVEGAEVRAVRGSVYDRPAHGPLAGAVDDLELLPPCEPTKVIGLAYNYKDLVGERESYEEPLIFLKPPTSVIPSTGAITLLPGLDAVWVEVEVAFVVRVGGRHISPDAGAEHILGFTVANDVTARNVHGRDHHLGRSKGLDTFCPVGRHLDTAIDTSDLRLRTTINGRLTQHGTTANRILSDAECLSLVSRFFTLAPGDLILTGTPAGAMDSTVHPGDLAVLEVAGLGRLANPIVAAGG